MALYFNVHGTGTARVVQFKTYEVSSCWAVILHDDSSAYDSPFSVILNNTL